MPSRSRRSARLVAASVVCGTALTVLCPTAVRALTVERCVSSDNHLYVILRTTSDRTRVTSVAMTNMSANACCESPVAGAVLTALAAGSGTLLPNRMRTTVISGLPSNGVSCGANFNATAAGGQGQLTLPGGATVSANPGFSSETVVSVATADGAVPAAFDVPTISRSISGCSINGETMAFPSTAGVHTPSDQGAGEQASQTATYDDTEGSTIGNRSPGNTVPPTQASADGFLLEGDCTNPATCEVIVFIATQNGNIAAGVAAGGFTIDPSEITESTECSANNILFNTPTGTATFTSTATSTATATATDTATATATATATNTPLPSSTTTATATVTTTGTITPTPTPTSPGICSLTPKAGCTTPVGYKRPLRINLQKQIVTWRWRSTGAIPLAALGDPVNTTTYSLCVYAGAVPTFQFELRAPADGTCNGKPCWKSRGAKGFRYRDTSRTNDGISRVVLRTQPEVLADLVMRARGPNLPSITLPFDQPVMAQLIKSDGPECWQSNYSPPPNKNTTNAYKDKND